MREECRVLWIISLCAGAAACSPAEFQKPVNDFAMATTSAEEAFVALDQQITDAYAERIKSRVLKGEVLVRTRAGDCEIVSERCRLEVVTAADAIEPFDPDPLLGNVVELMRLTSEYARGLADIANADSASKAATHVNAALGNVENLATTVDKLGSTNLAKDVTAFKTSSANFVNWALGRYVAAIQIEGLRKATATADPVIQEAANVFETAAAIAAPIFNKKLQQDFERARQKLEDDQQEGEDAALERNLEGLATRARDFDRVLLAKPSSVYGRLKEAHAALTSVLGDEKISFSTAAARIEAFAAEVKTLVDIVKELTAADAQDE